MLLGSDFTPDIMCKLLHARAWHDGRVTTAGKVELLESGMRGDRNTSGLRSRVNRKEGGFTEARIGCAAPKVGPWQREFKLKSSHQAPVVISSTPTLTVHMAIATGTGQGWGPTRRHLHSTSGIDTGLLFCMLDVLGVKVM